MAAKYIFTALAVVFLIAGTMRLVLDGGKPHPQTRTWLLIAAIFGAVSAWLFATT